MKKKYLALIPVVLVSVLIAFFATIQVTRENYAPTATSKPGETVKPEYKTRVYRSNRCFK